MSDREIIRSGAQPVIRCEDIEPLAVLYCCDELEPPARASLEAHVQQCPSCAAAFARELRLHLSITSLDQPADSLDRSGLLLARSRSELAEALDDEEARAAQRGWRGALSPAAWATAFRRALIYHPALSMTALVILGFLAGVAGQRWPRPASASTPVMIVSAPAPLSDPELQEMGISSINWGTPAGSAAPRVQVQLMSQTPMSIEGTPDDPRVRRLLTFALLNGQRFDPGVRLDSLEILRTRSADEDVRRALCSAARDDRDPGVRMNALETLQGFEQDPLVRQTLIDSLQKDSNSGVRIEAVNLLLNALRKSESSGTPAPDPQVLEVFRDRMQNDSNNYVRLQSAAALRQLGPGEDH